MTIQLKSYQLIALIVAAIVLLFIIFRGCNKIDPAVAESKRQVDSVIAAKKASEAASSIVIDSLSKIANHLTHYKDSISPVIVKQEQQLIVKNTSIASLANEVKLYKQYKDTIAQLKSCDELANQVSELTSINSSYINNNQLLRDSISASVGINSLIIAKKDYNYGELQGQFDFLARKYSKLDYNYTTQDRKLKRERTLSRILGIAVLVVGGAYLIK